MSDGELTKNVIEFTEVFAEYDDLVVFTPRLPLGENWAYLGQVAWNRNGAQTDHKGLILLAKEGSDALCDIVDWERALDNVEPLPFTTWRGIPADPERYVLGGHFFTLGMRKPTVEETMGIKAIRRDLVKEQGPDRLVCKMNFPMEIATFWDIKDTNFLYTPSGAFTSAANDSAIGLTLPVIYYNAA